MRGLHPLDRHVEAAAAVELTVRTAECVPAFRSGRQVPPDPLAGRVLVEPGPEPRPGPGQRLVRQLDRVVGDRDEPGVGQQVDDALAGRVFGQAAALHPGPERLTVRRRSDQPQHHPAQDLPLRDVESVVEPVSRTGHRPPDATRRAVAARRQQPSLAPLPGLGQGVGEEGQPTRLAVAVTQQQVHQAVLQPQAGSACRRLDGLAQCVAPQRPDQVQARLGHPGERLLAGQVAQMVRSDGEHHRGPVTGVRRELGEPTVRRVGVLTEREDLLELVDHQHRVLGRADQGRREGHGRVRSGHQHHDLTALVAQSRHQPGADQRRFPAPRWPRQDQHRVPVEPGQTGQRLLGRGRRRHRGR